jgi:beta-lactam-binding protein with PASTA domain
MSTSDTTRALEPDADPRRECAKCGELIPFATDWCPSCGRYVGWDEAPASSGVAPEVRAGGTPEPATTRSRVRLVVEPPPEGSAGRPPTELPVSPGGQVTLRLRVRNEGDTVANFGLTVEGLPAEWWTVKPERVFLNPWGKGEPCEAGIDVVLHPPRTSDATARRWPFRLVLRESPADGDGRSLRDAVEVSSIDAGLVVGPFVEVHAELHPTELYGRRQSRTGVELVNGGNADVLAELDARDAEAVCAFAFDDARPVVPRGGRRTVGVGVRGRARRWIGETVAHRFDIVVRPEGSGDDPAVLHGVFNQRPLLPAWLLRAVAVGVLVAIAAALLMARGSTVTVPTVEGRSLAAARADLDQAGLIAGSIVPADAPDSAIVVAQAPAGNEEVDEGSSVDLRVAVEAQTVTVPDVEGKPFAEAQRTLERAGLSVGSVEPADAPDDAEVVAQDPAPDDEVERGAGVDLSVSPPTTAVAVPDVTGTSLARARTALEAAGLTVGAVEPADASDEAEVVDQDPAPSTETEEGSSVDVTVEEGGSAMADADAICEDAYAAYQELPFGESPDEITLLQVEVNRIVRAAADSLRAAGSAALADAFDAYASAGEELALAYESGDTGAVMTAGDASSAAGDQAERLASRSGAQSCVKLAGI